MQPHATLPTSVALLLALLIGAPTAALARQGASRGAGVKVRTENGETVNLYNESYALIIGVSDYTDGWRSLPGVKKDVAAVERALLAHGFMIETLINPTGCILDQSVRDFIGRRGHAFGNRLLIYFAGHGETLETLDGRHLGYIVPADAPPASRNPGQFKQTAISMDMIDTYARLIESKHAMFVFDSCFSGSLFETSRAAPPPVIINRTTLPIRQFITAGTGEQEVPDRSIFREQFVEALNGKADRNGDGFITGSELGEFLEDTVTNYSRGTQTPRWGKIKNPQLDKGNFIFVSPSNSGGVIALGKAEDSWRFITPSQPASSGQLCSGISTLAASSRRGFYDIVGEAIDKSSASSFKPTIILPGTTWSMVVPDSYVAYAMAQSRNLGDVASEYYKLVTNLAECLPTWERKQHDSPADSSVGFRSTKFRDKNSGVVIQVYHMLPQPSASNAQVIYGLSLTVFKPGAGF